ncbi:MAG: hypothetical protein AAB800_02660 [Patescibacteria group bacterium]
MAGGERITPPEAIEQLLRAMQNPDALDDGSFDFAHSLAEDTLRLLPKDQLIRYLTDILRELAKKDPTEDEIEILRRSLEGTLGDELRGRDISDIDR